MPFTFHLVRKGSPITAEELTQLAANDPSFALEGASAMAVNPATGEKIELRSRALQLTYRAPNGASVAFSHRARSGELTLDCSPAVASGLSHHVRVVAGLLGATVEDDEGNAID
ncbi:MAG TPA: hypothetical protein VMV18_12400 [bacterium]|nr:hypothetical protein [bacterium]